MSIENQKFVVYVDTSYLINPSYHQRLGWERLLLYSKNCIENLKANPKLEIYIHQIVLEEYRTHLKDELSASVERLKIDLKNFRKAAQKNQIGRRLSIPDMSDFFLKHEQIEDESHKIIDELKRSGVVTVVPEEHHSQLVWRNYFSWSSLFDGIEVLNRSDKEKRQNRRLI